MAVLELFLSAYFWIALWWVFSLLSGTALITALSARCARGGLAPPNRELGIFFGMATGIALHIAVLILVAQLHLLTPAGLMLAASLVLVLSVWVLSRHLQSPWLAVLLQPARPAAWVLALPLLLMLAAWLVRPLGPGEASDEISYHLPYARFYLQQGGLAVQEFLRFPLQTHNFNLLYSVALLREGTATAHLVHATAGLLVLLGVHGMGRHWLGRGGAFIALILVMQVGTFEAAFASAFVDLGFTLYIAACLFALALWQEEREVAWLWLAGMFLGTAMGTKYLGLVFTAPLALWVLWQSRSYKDLLRFTLVTCLFGLFWYVRSWLISGNPVHHFLGEWFGYYIWTADDLTAQMSELHRHGVDRTVLNWLRLPEQLQMYKNKFNGEIVRDGVLVAGFYLGLLACYRMRPALRMFALISLFYLVLWFCSAQVMRYLLPIVPAMALVAAGFCVMVFNKLTRAWLGKPKLHTAVSAVLPALGLAFMLLFAGVFALRNIAGDLRRIPLLPAEQDAHLRANNAGYELFTRAAADARIGHGPLLQLGLESYFYYFPGVLYGDWNGPYSYLQYWAEDEHGERQLLAPAKFRDKLRQQGILGVVFGKGEGGIFYPKDTKTYTADFVTVFENQYGIVMVPRDQNSN